MGPWNWLDWVLATITFVSVVSAFSNGFTRELISLASVAAALIVAATGYQKAALWFTDIAKTQELALGLGFLALFLGTLFVGGLISRLVRQLIRTVGLQFFDRLMGALFGFVRGVVVDSILIMAMVAFALKPAAVQTSQLAPYVVTGARVIAAAMPENLKAPFRDGFNRLRESIKKPAE